MSRNRNYAFTWNNYNKQSLENLKKLNESQINFIIFGHEVGEKGTPHLQGYVEFTQGITLIQCKKRLDPTNGSKSPVHVEVAKGNRQQNVEYCSKEGDFYLNQFKEKHQGKRTDWIKIKELIDDTQDFAAVANEYPEQAIKYHSGIDRLIKSARDEQAIINLASEMNSTPLYIWQSNLVEELKSKPHQRKIIWFSDEVGNTGKSFLAKYLLANGSAYFRNGKSADIAHAYKGQRIAVFDFTRSQEDHINYEIIESIKDGVVFSPKYDSTTKAFSRPWVVVFANFQPILSKVSLDRWDIRSISRTECVPTELSSVIKQQSDSDVDFNIHDGPCSNSFCDICFISVSDSESYTELDNVPPDHS